jgi:hypothetical protein
MFLRFTGSENCDCSCSECSCESGRDGDCSIENIRKLPSPIVVSSSNRASFAAITRVNSSALVCSDSSSAKCNAKEHSQSYTNYSNTSPSPGHSQSCADIPEVSLVKR